MCVSQENHPFMSENRAEKWKLTCAQSLHKLATLMSVAGNHFTLCGQGAWKIREYGDLSQLFAPKVADSAPTFSGNSPLKQPERQAQHKLLYSDIEFDVDPYQFLLLRYREFFPFLILSTASYDSRLLNASYRFFLAFLSSIKSFKCATRAACSLRLSSFAFASSSLA